MRKFTLLFVTLVFTFSSFGQWSVGPRLGVNFSTLTGKWNSNDDSKSRWITGPVVGAVGNYSFTDMFSLNAELLYITMGEKTIYTYSEESRALNSQTYWEKEKYHCFQLPILFRADFLTNSLFFAFFGPYFTYKLGGKWKDSDGNSGKIKIQEHESRDDGNTWYLDPDYNRRFDFGIYLGAGAGKKLGPGRLEVDLRYGIGLLDLNKFDDKDDKQNAKDNGYKAYRSMNISLSVAYMFPLGKDNSARFLD